MKNWIGVALAFLIATMAGSAMARRPHAEKPQQPAAGCNGYGCWEAGGGCNGYGCWKNGGGCNGYGCWNSAEGACNGYGCSDVGACNGYGCPKGGAIDTRHDGHEGRVVCREGDLEVQLTPAGANSYGRWEAGGGCNSYGCWTGNGGCNSYGCWNTAHGACNSYGCSGVGACNSYGCPKGEAPVLRCTRERD